MTAGGAPIAVHTLDEAAVILRVKPSWLERQAAARRIPFTMLGGSYHFTAEHLLAIIRQFERRPTAEIAEDSEHPITRRSAAGRLLTDIKTVPLRPRPQPRRAA
jgi:excisionase family DNA binding protein